MRKPTIRSDTNQPVQLQKQARSLQFIMKVEEELHYPCTENKGANQLYSTAQLTCAFVFANADCWFSDVVAHLC